jgi:hypothetical protein
MEDDIPVQLGVLKNVAEELNLPLTLKAAVGIIERLGNYSSDKLRTDVFELQRRAGDELDGTRFLCVPNELVRYFDSTDLFGPEVATNFSRASFDISEAGNGMALGCDTAAIFHLMRVLELGLDSLSFELGKDVGKNWGAALSEIASAIKGMERDQSWTAKANWRDLRHSYAQAANIFISVRSFMQEISKSLKQR